MNKGRHIGKWVNDTGLPKKRRRALGRGKADLIRKRRLLRERKQRIDDDRGGRE